MYQNYGKAIGTVINNQLNYNIMDNLKRKVLYNHMYFDESASQTYDRNGDFWIELSCLCRNHPEITIMVEYIAVKDRYVSHLLQDVRVTCDHDEFQKICDQIYRSLYYRVPLIFHKEFEGRDDILKDVLESCEKKNI